MKPPKHKIHNFKLKEDAPDFLVFFSNTLQNTMLGDERQVHNTGSDWDVNCIACNKQDVNG